MRSISVLEAVASYLKITNKNLFVAKDRLDGVTDLAGVIKPCFLEMRRVLRWAFAALANLDSLQSLEADVAHVLQVIRRCCRWLKSVIAEVDLQGDIRLVEVVIQDFFRQC